MTPIDTAALALLDRALLRCAGRFVPHVQRDEWTRSWQAELWCKRHRYLAPGPFATADLSVGLLLDATWLRVESWQRLLRGTASLCLGSLSGLCLLAIVVSRLMDGSFRAVVRHAGECSGGLLAAALLVSLVSFAIGPKTSFERGRECKGRHWLRRQGFLVAKIALLLVLIDLLSVDLCAPIAALSPNIAQFLDVLTFSLFALVGLRWAVQDQEQRCRRCLRVLAAPARVGRPSHNLLEWNGTELVCKHGHGSLSIPELETSWCQSSEWTGGETDVASPA